MTGQNGGALDAPSPTFTFTSYGLLRVHHGASRSSDAGTVWSGSMTFVTPELIPPMEEYEVARDLEAVLLHGDNALSAFGGSALLQSISFSRARDFPKVATEYGDHVATVVTLTYRSYYTCLTDIEARIKRALPVT